MPLREVRLVRHADARAQLVEPGADGDDVAAFARRLDSDAALPSAPPEPSSDLPASLT
jgi:hypothetical protein